MPIIVEENQKGKLKRRQSYRSQRPDSGEKDRLTNADIEEVNERLSGTGMKYGGMKKKTKKMKHGGMSKARGTGCAIRGTNFKGIF